LIAGAIESVIHSDAPGNRPRHWGATYWRADLHPSPSTKSVVNETPDEKANILNRSCCL